MRGIFWLAASALLLVCSAAIAQTPYRADAWRDHSADAFMQASFAGQTQPVDPEAGLDMGNVRGKCAGSAKRPLPTPSSLLEMSIGFSGNCGREGAAVITIDRVVSNTSTQSIAIWNLPAAEVGIETFGPVFGVTKAAFMEKANKALVTAISLAPFPASKLPAWKQGQTIPKLPLGLSWLSGTERDLYEAIRAQNHEIVCVFYYGMTCAAIVPERGQRMIPMLNVGGLSDIYAVKDASAALAVLTGATPPLTRAQYQAANAREEAKMRRVFDAAMDAATRYEAPRQPQ